MKKITFLLTNLAMALLLTTSCEKAAFDEPATPNQPQPEETGADMVTLTFTVAQIAPEPFSTISEQSRATAVGEVCSRVNVALYKPDGERVKSVNQKADDAGFGKVSLTVPAGSYRLVVLAHSCDGNATTTNMNKITFPNNKTTDTFYYSTEFSTTTDLEQQLVLRRITAMVRLVVKDALPDNVKRMKFYYTGGSSTLDGATGLGCVNSKQTEYRDIAADKRGGGATFEIFTLPHDASGQLKLTISALDASDNVVKELQLDDVPISVNTITEYSGNFFTGSGGDDDRGSDTDASGFTLTVEDQWEKVNTYSY